MKKNVTKGHAWLLKQETKDQAAFTRAHIPLNIYSIHQLHTVHSIHSHSPHSFLSQQHCPAAPSAKSAAGPSCTALPTFPTGWPSHLGSPNGSKPKWDLQCPANSFFTAENETSSPRNTSNYSILEHEAWRSFEKNVSAKTGSSDQPAAIWSSAASLKRTFVSWGANASDFISSIASKASLGAATSAVASMQTVHGDWGVWLLQGRDKCTDSV